MTNKWRGSGIIKFAMVIAVICILGFIGWYIFGKAKYSLFKGKITVINRACDFDGRCSLTIDGKIVVTGGGLSPKREDNVFGMVDSDLKIGEWVEVKALPGDNGYYTLQRCEECYIKRTASD